MGCCGGDGDDNENVPRINSDEQYYGNKHLIFTIILLICGICE